MHSDIGSRLLEALRSARRGVVIAAPFVKLGALNLLLSAVCSRVAVEVFTRWSPMEVAAGVSDLAVRDLVLGRACSDFALVPNLHAKYYRVDGSVLTGSANVTGAALGWSDNPNLEILHPLHDPEGKTSAAFEKLLRSLSWRPDQEYCDEMERLATRLGRLQADLSQAHLSLGLGGIAAKIHGSNYRVRERVWIPATRNPEKLFRQYSDPAVLSTGAAHQQVGADLAALGPPPGLDEEEFRGLVGLALRQHSLTRCFDDALMEGPQRFGEMRIRCREWMRTMRVEGCATSVLQTMLRWMVYFCGSRYRVEQPAYTEVLSLRTRP